MRDNAAWKEVNMDIFGVLSMVGGLALFLFGMHIMGEGLEKLSGGRMERLLERLTSNRLMAVILGLGVTAVIQSSSATTVMVVGFVNSGIMRLKQAVGIIMGANIGTTVTSWLLSLTGIEGDNLLIKLLKPSSFAPVLAVIGVVFIVFLKSEKKANIGNILIGFAILMTGMDTMSAAVKPLADMPSFTGMLTMFSNPILGMLAGAILTAIIQSSSASVGILQALCATGAVSFGTALPIIMGQNIGTCITAIMSSFGATKNAKRAAAVHLLFNVIGTAVFMIAFYIINAVVKFEFLNEAANPAGIAIVHSIFNVTATVLLFPFANLLEKLAILIIPDKENEEEEDISCLARLDERFLNNPALAVEECRTVAINMAELSKKAIFAALDLFKVYDESKVNRIVELEDAVDKYEDALGSYLVKLSSKNLSQRDSHSLSVILHCIGDFERISDHAVNVAMASKEMNDKGMEFSQKACEELDIFAQCVKDIVDTTVASFDNNDIKLAKKVEPLEQVIDYIKKEEKQRHIRRLRKGKCTIELGFVLSDILTNLGRVSDHCSNIAVCVLQVDEDSFDTHEYLGMVKDVNNEEFRYEYMALKEKYRLPGKSRTE